MFGSIKFTTKEIPMQYVREKIDQHVEGITTNGRRLLGLITELSTATENVFGGREPVWLPYMPEDVMANVMGELALLVNRDRKSVV
jgi:hypothetical protein